MRAGAPSAACASDAAGGAGRAGRAWLALVWSGLVWPGLVWLGLACALLPFAWAFGFCFPRGDDFDEVTRAMFLFDLPGGLYEVGREWLTWSGRYTYHFLAVFLGKAGEMRPVCGLACGAVLALHGLALYGLAREAGAPRRRALPLACLAVLALCACYRPLQIFYLLTDALTTGLQSAAALCFFWCLCALWNRRDAMPAPAPPVRRVRRVAALVGVLATGVYEHAALAVLSGAGCACALAWLRDRREGLPFRQGRARLFFVVALWCCGGLLFSFLAPGNFNRRQVRGIAAETVRHQLEAVPADWVQALSGFALSAWPLVATGLTLLVLLARRGSRAGLAPGDGLSHRERLALAALVVAAFCAASFGLTVLHALSDVPLRASPKLSASLALYAAFAFGFAVYAVFSGRTAGRPGRPARAARAGALLLGAGLLALGLASDNYRLTLRNAVNGSMALYAATMETRAAWLRHEAAQLPGQKRFRFGLAGEILHPGSRARKLAPDAVWTVVAQWLRPVFPVAGGEPLPAHAGTWPNLWVAWMYGLPAVASAPPQPAAAVAALAGAAPDGTVAPRAPEAPGAPEAPVELRLTEAARRAGLTGAWRVNARGGPNPTFALTWLVLQSTTPLPERVSLLVPSPLSRGRMAPLAVQSWLLEGLDRQEGVRPDTGALLAAPELGFASAAWRVAPPEGEVGTTAAGPARAARFRYAFPLGPAAPLAPGTGATPPGLWPPALFLRLSGETFLRLASTPAPKAASLAHVRF